MTNCSLSAGIAVHVSTVREAEEVVNYLVGCNIENPECLYGNAIDAYYGISILDKSIRCNGSYKYTTTKFFTRHITFEEFQKLISVPTESKVINNYEIF